MGIRRGRKFCKIICKVFIVFAVFRLVISLINITIKKIPYYDSKRIKVIDDKYYKIICVSDAILCVGIIIISLLSAK